MVLNGTINDYDTKENSHKRFIVFNSSEEKVQMIAISDIRILEY